MPIATPLISLKSSSHIRVPHTQGALARLTCPPVRFPHYLSSWVRIRIFPFDTVWGMFAPFICRKKWFPSYKWQSHISTLFWCKGTSDQVSFFRKGLLSKPPVMWLWCDCHHLHPSIWSTDFTSPRVLHWTQFYADKSVNGNNTVSLENSFSDSFCLNVLNVNLVILMSSYSYCPVSTAFIVSEITRMHGR